MPERGFATETWTSDDWFQELTRDQRYLFIYLWTNGQCNPAGLYHITLTTMANESKFSKDDLPALLKSLAPKVEWYPDANLIWVKNFLKRQAKSSKFVAAAAKCLVNVNSKGAVTAFLEYNQKRYGISIPYQYYIDKLSIPPAHAGASDLVCSSASAISGKIGSGEETKQGGVDHVEHTANGPRRRPVDHQPDNPTGRTRGFSPEEYKRSLRRPKKS